MGSETSGEGVAARYGGQLRAAALVLGGLLWCTLPGAPEAAPACPNPVESEARLAFTTAVRCSDAPQSRETLRGPARLLFGGRLDLNGSDPRAFEVLPGIGPARAAAIAAERPYGAVSQLERVRGIGPVTLRRIAPYLTVASFDGSPSPESMPR